MVTVRLFAQAREAVGSARLTLNANDVATVADVLAATSTDPAFVEVLSISKVWVNGEQAALTDGVQAGDEVAVLPPVSGG